MATEILIWCDEKKQAWKFSNYLLQMQKFIFKAQNYYSLKPFKYYNFLIWGTFIILKFTFALTLIKIRIGKRNSFSQNDVDCQSANLLMFCWNALLEISTINEL